MEEKRQREIPSFVAARAKSAGAAGEAWLAGLDGMIARLEEEWRIFTGRTLSGGSHAYVAEAEGQDGEKYVLKIDMPEDLGGDFANGIAALKAADGRGYVRLFAYDSEKKACLLERLGNRLGKLGYPTTEQMRVICSVLQESWSIPVEKGGFPSGNESVAWFRDFIQKFWNQLNRPCKERVILQAMRYLTAREEAMNPAEYVLVHGDAHADNTLQTLSGEKAFKLIDPDGIFYEKAYDLGVLMREWIDEYEPDPLQKGRERCEYLHSLTGVPGRAIWEWGFLQTVSTAFVLLQTGREELGYRMLRTAEAWCLI